MKTFATLLRMIPDMLMLTLIILCEWLTGQNP
jgi:hypothetical protein